MTYKLDGTCIKLCAIVLCFLTIHSCTKDPANEIEIDGNYCTYREGPTGHTTSSLSISQDTSDKFDYLISNISGYDNTSEAFKIIGCDRLLNRLVIPEASVLVGNGNTMVITGEADIQSDGSIQFNISTSSDTNDNTYSLYLNNSNSFNYYNMYTGENQSLSIEVSQVLLKFKDEDDLELSFIIEDTENQDCSIFIPRQSLIDQNTNTSYLVETEIYFGGSEVFGTVYYSSGSWQNAQSKELKLN